MKISSGTAAVLIMVAGLLAYKYYGNVNYAWAGFVSGLLIWSFSTYLSELKYKSPIVISGTVHGSFDKVYLVHDYVVIPLGSVKAEGFYLEGGTGLGGEGFIIAPADAFMWVGSENAIVLADPVETPVEKLPSPVADFIAAKWGIKDDMKLYYTETMYPVQALSDEDIKTYIVSVQGRMDEKIKNLNAQISMLKDLLSGKYDVVLEYADVLGYLSKNLSKTPQREQIKAILTRPPSEEEE